jgi:hypothetical protein
MPYRVSELERSSLIRVVGDWLDSDRPVFCIFVDSIRGKGKSTSQTQRGEFGADLIADLISAEYFVDQVIETFGDFGGKLQLRVVFADDEGNADWEHEQKKRFNLIAESPGTRTGSSGEAAATEQLSQSLSKGFDSMILRHGGDRSERFFERLLELQAAGSNATTSQAIALQEQIARANFAEFRLEIMQENQETSIGSLLIEAMPMLVQSPLLANVADLVGAFAEKITADARPIPTVPTPEPQPEATPE